MTFPTVQSVTPTSFASTSTNHAVQMPAVASAGDLLVILFSLDGAGGTTTTPSGWTNQVSAAGTLDRIDVYAIAATGTEGGTTVNCVTSVTSIGCAQVWRVSNWWGVVATGVANASAGTGSSVNPDPPSLSPAWGSADTLWLAAMVTDNDSAGTISGYPASYNLNQTETNTVIGDAQKPTIGSCGRNVTTGTENPGTFTTLNDAWIALTLGIRPAAPPLSPPMFTSRPNRIWRLG